MSFHGLFGVRWVFLSYQKTSQPRPPSPRGVSFRKARRKESLEAAAREAMLGQED